MRDYRSRPPEAEQRRRGVHLAFPLAAQETTVLLGRIHVVDDDESFRSAIARWLKPATLRQQFVLTEVFQPPLGMRDERFG